MKKVAIHQSNYIPWKGYFDLINSVDVFIIYDEVQYTKNDWRNRNKIKTIQGDQWLTVPVKQESLSQKIFETKVSFSKWNKKHWSSLKTNYGKAHNFKEKKDWIEKLYLNCNFETLSEINLYFIKAIVSHLNINTKIIDSRDLNLQGDRNSRLIDAIKKVDGNQYISGPAARSYIDKKLFESNNIELEWKEYSNYKEYKQLHEPFNHKVSILDLIFCAKNISADLFTEKKNNIN